MWLTRDRVRPDNRRRNCHLSPAITVTHRSLHLLLVLALLLFSWTELAHKTDLDAHHDGQGCEICVLAAHLGHGATSAGPQLPVVTTHDTAPRYSAAASLPQPFRHTLGQRGPPRLS